MPWRDFATSASADVLSGEPVSWSREFDDPIPLPRGRQPSTLEDAGAYITKLPEAVHMNEDFPRLCAECGQAGFCHEVRLCTIRPCQKLGPSGFGRGARRMSSLETHRASGRSYRLSHCKGMGSCNFLCAFAIKIFAHSS
jgi:hypothetical protein